MIEQDGSEAGDQTFKARCCLEDQMGCRAMRVTGPAQRRALLPSGLLGRVERHPNNAGSSSPGVVGGGLRRDGETLSLAIESTNRSALPNGEWWIGGETR